MDKSKQIEKPDAGGKPNNIGGLITIFLFIILFILGIIIGSIKGFFAGIGFLMPSILLMLLGQYIAKKTKNGRINSTIKRSNLLIGLIIPYIGFFSATYALHKYISKKEKSYLILGIVGITISLAIIFINIYPILAIRNI